MQDSIKSERAHHSYSPSTLGNLEACPAYQSQQSDAPHERTTAGTRAHDVVETGTDDARLDDDDAVAAAECLDFLNRRRQLMEEARTRALDAAPGPITDAGNDVPQILELKEVYLAVDDKKFEGGVTATTAGYVDRVLIDHTRAYAELFDWKFGMWAVEKAEDNPQVISYVLGLFREYPALQQVRAWLKQPHIDLISEALFSRAQIPVLYLRIQTIVARAREARKLGDFSMANPVVPACNFCANLGRCPKVAEFACKVGHKFHPLAIPENITPTMVLSGPDTTLAMRLSQVMGVWAQAFRTQVTDRVLRGDAPIPEGYSIQQNSKREVVDEKKFREIALRFLTEKEYNEICPVPGFGVTEDIVKEKAPRGSKKAAVEQFQNDLEQGGAVQKGASYSFLRAVTTPKEDKQANQ